MKIAFTTILPEEGFQRLQGHTLYAPLEEAEVLVSTFDYRVTREMISSAPYLRLITNFGVGFNNIDLDACRERGIRVTNTPQPVIEPTAELAFALMHDVARRTAEFDRKLRLGTAEAFGVMNNLSHSLYGKTLGIIGMGRIGQALAKRAVASGMKIIYFNRNRLDSRIEALYNAEYVSLDELFTTADVVSVNAPHTAQTTHIVDAHRLEQMKPTAILVNTARGPLVDELALARALQEKKIYGAGLDVFEFGDKVSPEILACDNAVITPHLGTQTFDVRNEMAAFVSRNIINFYEGGKICRVN